jgi:hypothetical protein
LPNPTSGGGALTAWTVATYLADRGHDVTVCALRPAQYYDPTGAGASDRAATLEARGIAVRTIVSHASTTDSKPPGDLVSRVRRTVRIPDTELFPSLHDREAVRAELAAVAPDVVFVYHFEALAASRGLGLPRFAAVGDPSHLPVYYRWRASFPSRDSIRLLPRLQAVLRAQPKLLVRLLNECEGSGAFAAHHAAQLRRLGAHGCEYLRTPVPDPGRLADAGSTGGKPRLLLLGHLKGVVTLDGLRVFARETLPVLERELGPDGFEVRVVGGFDPPAEFREVFEHPSMQALGHADDPSDEIRTADAMLVPTSIPLGIRVRIITGFAYGARIVAHRANALGIPELEHGRNSLLAGDGAGLARETVRLLGDAALRRQLETGARETFERFFSPDVAARHIEERLVQVAGAASPVPG